MTPRRPRRALLFCPGTERRMIEKAAALDVDGVILDLEDAAALSRKQEARDTATRALAECDFGDSERIVRINPVGSGLEDDDLGAVLDAARLPDAIVLPKTEGADAIAHVSSRLADGERARGAPVGAVRLLALIETAKGVVRLAEIAAAHPRVDALLFGAEDLCGDVGATRTLAGDEVRWAQQALVLHAAAFGLQAIDTPFVDLADVERLRRDTRAAMELGYTGRMAIHPRQIAPIVETFTPSAAEIAAAARLTQEHERHQAGGRGVFELDGRMVDMPMVRAAERVLARARAAGALDET